jgi:hypothetical protein
VTPLEKLVRARDAVAEAEEATRLARRRFREALREAHDAGESYSALSRVRRVTRQRVAHLIGEE